jgi:hypothetical protein
MSGGVARPTFSEEGVTIGRCQLCSRHARGMIQGVDLIRFGKRRNAAAPLVSAPPSGAVCEHLPARPLVQIFSRSLFGGWG